MNLDPLHNAVTGMTSLFSGIVGIWPNDGTGLLMPALAGAAAAMAVALAVTIYLRAGYHSYRDMIRHGLMAAIGLALLTFAIFDIRNAALAHLVNTTSPTTEFELRWKMTTDRAKALPREMDRNRTIRSLPEARLV